MDYIAIEKGCRTCCETLSYWMYMAFEEDKHDGDYLPYHTIADDLTRAATQGCQIYFYIHGKLKSYNVY